MSDGNSTTISFPPESKFTRWEPLPSELRWLSTLGRLQQGVKELQMAWRCREDGRIEWRTIPLHVVSEEDFTGTGR